MPRQYLVCTKETSCFYWGIVLPSWRHLPSGLERMRPDRGILIISFRLEKQERERDNKKSSQLSFVQRKNVCFFSSRTVAGISAWWWQLALVDVRQRESGSNSSQPLICWWKRSDRNRNSSTNSRVAAPLCVCTSCCCCCRTLPIDAGSVSTSYTLSVQNAAR